MENTSLISAGEVKTNHVQEYVLRLESLKEKKTAFEKEIQLQMDLAANFMLKCEVNEEDKKLPPQYYHFLKDKTKTILRLLSNYKKVLDMILKSMDNFLSIPNIKEEDVPNELLFDALLVVSKYEQTEFLEHNYEEALAKIDYYVTDKGELLL